jgi:biopolymer transport protein ExbD
MAEVQHQEGGAKKGKRRAKKLSTHIDMTPMVDLACLLITFFMLTASMSKPKVMELGLPPRDQDTAHQRRAEVSKNRTLNIILTEKDRIYYYIGLATPKEMPVLIKSDFSKDGIRKVLLKKNLDLFGKIDELKQKFTKGEIKISQDSLKNSIKQLKRQDKVGPIVLIKADDKAKYKNIVDIIDEMAITNISIYTLADINPLELEILKNSSK